MTSAKALGHASMLVFSALVAISFTLGSVIASEIDPVFLTLIRFVIAALVMTALAGVSAYDRRDLVRHMWRWLIVGGCMAAYFILMFEALRLTTALATSAVFTLTPLMAAGFGLVLTSVSVGRTTLAALLIGAVGALWVIFRGDPDRALALDFGNGEALFLIGAVCHAAVPALTRRLVPGAPAFEAAFGSILGALTVTFIYSLTTAVSVDFPALRPTVWWVALYLGTVTTAGTFFLLQVAIARITPGEVMAYTYLVPSWVVVHGLIMGRSEAASLYIGVILTLVALLILLLSDSSRSAVSGPNDAMLTRANKKLSDQSKKC